MTAKEKNSAKKKPVKKDKALNKEFPGYPKYDASEDIFVKGERVDKNLEENDQALNQGKNDLSIPKTEIDNTDLNADDSKITNEDLEALGPTDLSLDMGDDEQLKHRTTPVDFTGNDLDVPGVDDDDVQEEIGSEDEENNIYSLGGDDKENLEERKD
jgi:hypothetical protein